MIILEGDFMIIRWCHQYPTTIESLNLLLMLLVCWEEKLVSFQAGGKV